ncbi:triphosphoribosyl-dephospho-CoA synthase, partial [Escherichia coli]|uniref:triphosphoribosyl-dephospho-CoA synthase n=1 Tax=Escherichia coli TaxID=562 RepID=UPI00387F20A4
MSMPATSTKTTKLATSLIDEYALLGWRAMLTEVNLSPKPGLVDRINCGAHKDMALEDFHRSALAIQGWLPRFIEFGACSAEMAPEAVGAGLRPMGMACEGDMCRAKSGAKTRRRGRCFLGVGVAASGR